MKLPSTFKAYFEKVDQKSFFVTTIDRKLLYIYPLAVWRQNEQTLEAMTNSEAEMRAAEAITFLANHYGGDAGMDGEGRVLIPQELRKELDMNDTKVWVAFEKGKIVGYNGLEYKKKFGAALEDISGSLMTAKLKGLK